MKFKTAFFGVCFTLLAYYSMEIVFRRWIWGQVPAQVPGWFVGALLLVNVAVIVGCSRRLWR